MSDAARDLLVRGIAAAKAKDKDQARFYLEWVLRTDADRHQKIRAWLWLSEVSEDPAEKRDCLENVLAHEPTNPLARRGMAILKGQLDPKDLFDPSRQSPTPTPASPQPAETRRFVCQQCGGKMKFAPDGASLTCAYCDRELTLYQAIEEGAMVDKKDFAVALATAQGHTHPVATQSFTCQTCGVSFVLGPDILSLTCSYCASTYVVETSETRQLVPPEGIIPFASTQEEAHDALRKWFAETGLKAGVKTSPPEGTYLPAWTFDVGGEVQWTGKGLERQHGWTNWVSQTGSYPVFQNDVLVSASHTLPAELAEELDHFQLDELIPYDPGYLADWPAEIYQVSVSDASLVARRKAWREARRAVSVRVQSNQVRDLKLSSAGIIIEAFKLILLPVWMARYRLQDQNFAAVVNGQTGKVRGQRPQGRVQKWLAGFLSVVTINRLA
jgi:hypothetical protein